MRKFSKLSSFLVLSLACMSLLISACSSGPDRKVFVYGFGNMTVLKTDTVEDINQKVIERYGSDLFWSPR